MDHVRVHPRFLHSNATSHKWALGAFAELLDNALDEVCNGATYVNVDMVMKANTKMLVVQDGNGFKTSSMRLGADVIVFSRFRGKYGLRYFSFFFFFFFFFFRFFNDNRNMGRLYLSMFIYIFLPCSTTQSIGLLSFTFLQNTGKEDIIVPIVDYEKTGETWNKRLKSSDECWQRNLETVVQWSPYDSEEELVGQFNFLEDQGTRIVIYNLWEDDEGLLELDFEADQNDIQTRAGNRDDKKLMTIANDHPSSRRFLTYRHSLRSYASILYRRIPPGFSIILRGKEVEYHDIVDDLIHPQKHVYKPVACASSKDPNMSAAVTLGFIKDAGHHIDVQGFNVYHKNRLIRPFWRLWNASGSDGRGVIGVLEANFVEPAHDKQGFERTTALSRLEARLIHLQKTYWSTNCHLIGYAQRRHSKKPVSPEKEEASPPNADDKSNSTHNTTSAPKWNGKKGQKSSPVVRERNRFEAQPAVNHNTSSSSSPLRVAPESMFPPQDAQPSNMLVKIEDVNKAGPTPPFSSLTEMVLKLMDENRNLRNRYSN
ncbi:PREDICTED: MORC family CW-type zinc finger protein 4-like [Erythranthe guttata]|uniref:MORC family CW-type zinc finger protein 4-like n=1 Tax=Erythranthe guttata TaxID=4155 RepID=UPI00064DDF87|nr:PREDICTED: MORC family CW-type zinc finger protein 4-like [Erythranthe guttata]|eukprot:XP_012845745.1 PREDICTED: MORC family CW-type zinc finger protein 4-like [Erythranthe guttata]